MTQRDPAFNCLFDTITGFLLPFFLAGAGGNPEAARVAVAALINAYNPRTTAELDLVGRIIGFSTVALDNLRLSMLPDLPDTKVLRYRSSAVSLSRAAEQARHILRATQEQGESTRAVPRPSVVPAPVSKPAASVPQPRSATTAQPAVSPQGMPPMDIEAMKRDARIMIEAFSKQGAGSTAIHMIPDPAAAVTSAARAAVQAARHHPSLDQSNPARHTAAK